MKIEYDKQTDSLYIHLSEVTSIESEEVSKGVVVDYDEAGHPVGIDIQQASTHVDLNEVSFSNLLPPQAA